MASQDCPQSGQSGYGVYAVEKCVVEAYVFINLTFFNDIDEPNYSKTIRFLTVRIPSLHRSFRDEPLGLELFRMLELE